MELINFFQNSNIGLFFYTNNKITIVPEITPKKTIDTIKKELKTKIIVTNVYKSSVPGIFLSGNDEYLFVPKGLTEKELKKLEETKMKIITIDSELNTLGNNMVFNGKKVMVNPEYSEKIIKQLGSLGFKVVKNTLAGVNTVGANIVVSNGNALVNPDISKDESVVLQEGFGVDYDYGTLNAGGKIVKAGLVINKHGSLVGFETTGPEMMRVEEIFFGK